MLTITNGLAKGNNENRLQNRFLLWKSIELKRINFNMKSKNLKKH